MPAGITTDVREAQLQNARLPMLSRPAGRVIDVIAVPLNADWPMLVTPDGIVIDVRDPQPKKRL